MLRKKTKLNFQAAVPPWIELPRDITANILQRLGVIEILENAQKVCTTWQKVCQDPSMWQFIDMRNMDCGLRSKYTLNAMCRHAVDRSQGQLPGVHLEYFGKDETLQYIAQRSSNLRRLSLAYCYDITTKVLVEAVGKLPQLEELHIFNKSLRGKQIEKIGFSCPMLKSFTLNECRSVFWFPFPRPDDKLNAIAMAVAKSMPNLLHLQLFGNNMKNEGLQAILDGCRRLESLDLRKCKRIDLSGDLGKRCFEQIKDLRLPHDSVDDYEWDTGAGDRVLDPNLPDNEYTAFIRDFLLGRYAADESFPADYF